MKIWASTSLAILELQLQNKGLVERLMKRGARKATSFGSGVVDCVSYCRELWCGPKIFLVLIPFLCDWIGMDESWLEFYLGMKLNLLLLIRNFSSIWDQDSVGWKHVDPNGAIVMEGLVLAENLECMDSLCKVFWEEIAVVFGRG
ncbi:unnamed protein product [Dovyalis caffra]|uniref:Uncharacterized protein n=1 Tax=Dovyalis caffra TaxID=77055 RepID=A0AAV1R7Y8_9ROSI|nr:unnamed protein product [Dovyalis caffra]